MKKLFYKIAVLIMAAAIAQIIIFKYVVAPIPEVSLLNKYLLDGYDIIYFGDSVIDFQDETDSDRSSIVKMLSDMNPDNKIADFSHGANQTEVYEAAMEYITRSPSKPQAVILHINPATLSPVWNMTPGLQFEKEKFYFRDHAPLVVYFYRPLAISGALDVNPVNERQYMETIIYRGDIAVGTVREFTDEKKFATTTPERIRDTFISRYMSPITRNHKKLTALSRTIDTAKKAGIKVYVYVTPINYERGTLFVGPDFLEQIRKNITVICDVIEKKGLECLNLAFSLNSDNFNYNRGYATEHIKESGRKLVAKKLNEIFLSK